MREIKKRINHIYDALGLTHRNTVNKLLDLQYEVGLDNYGETLEDASDSDYDWNAEAMLELIDAIQYQVKRNIELEKTITKLDKENDVLNGIIKSLRK